MKNLLIGSRALAFWNPSLKIKESTDYDVVSEKPLEGTEWHDPESLNNRDIEHFVTDHFITLNKNKLYIVNMKGLAVIKRSHLWRHLGFQKHITHYYKYGLSEAFKKLTVKEQYIYSCREKVTKNYFKINHPPLNKSKEDFFSDGIYRKYDHDYLHELVAYNKFPLYELLQEYDEEIHCSKDNWEKLSYDQKLKCVAEEVYVTALERFIFVDNPIPEKLAYIKSLDKVCTTMCSGWFRDFAIENYPNIISLFDINKIIKVRIKLGE